jgi:hypothetical protein
LQATRPYLHRLSKQFHLISPTFIQKNFKIPLYGLQIRTANILFKKSKELTLLKNYMKLTSLKHFQTINKKVKNYCFMNIQVLTNNFLFIFQLTPNVQ